jgi:hypothetical protein
MEFSLERYCYIFWNRGKIALGRVNIMREMLENDERKKAC